MRYASQRCPGTNEMRDAAAAYTYSLQTNSPPPIDGGEDTYTYLRERNLSIDPKVKITLDDEVVELVATSKANLAHAESEMLRAKGHLLAHMGTAKTALDKDGKVIAARQAKGEGAVPFVVLK